MSTVLLLLSLLPFVAVVSGALPLLSQTATCPPVSQQSDVDSGDTSWMVASSALVLIMTPGLGFFYGGLVRHKNIVNTITLSWVAMCVVMVQWVLFGYSFAFGPGTGGFGSFANAALIGVDAVPNPAYGPTVPSLAYCNFQMMFAVITPALISGGIVERMSFRSYILFVLLWTTLCYDPLAHWVWSSWLQNNDDGSCTLRFGWLRDLGALDFAGGTVIHISSGFAALVAAFFVGKRKELDDKSPHVPSSPPWVIMGAALLWFGWIGFNGGSAVAANNLAVVATINTSIAAASAFLTYLFLDIIFRKAPSAVGACSGSVIGLVAITPASGFVNPGWAIVIGAVATMVCYGSIKLKRFIPVDDSLDVFYCHGIGGICGAIMTGLFASLDVNPTGANGAFYGNPTQLGIQIVTVIMAILISTLVTAGILLAIKYTIGLRSHPDQEETGLDKGIHLELGWVPDEHTLKFFGMKSLEMYPMSGATSILLPTAKGMHTPGLADLPIDTDSSNSEKNSN